MTSAIINNFKAEYSENILPITALITDNTVINYSDDGVVTLSDDYQFSDNKSLKLDLPLSTTLPKISNFNVGSGLLTSVKYDGRYIFSFRFLDKTSKTSLANVTLGFNVFINSVLTFTFDKVIDLDVHEEDKFYTIAQSFDLNADDIVDFSFFVSSDSITPSQNVYLYFSGFKLELDDRFLGIPSIYSKPIDTISDTGFQTRTDLVNTQTLLPLTDNLISFEGTLEENGGLNILDATSKITPIELNDIMTVDFAFTGLVPAGSNLFLSIYLKVSGIVYRAVSVPIVKGVGIDDYFSVSWVLPVQFDFLTNGAEIYVNPNVEITISNRYISVTRIAKGK